ncbi:hypothetical protein JCM18897A_22680 [Streptomyces sp. JCM 18897]
MWRRQDSNLGRLSRQIYSLRDRGPFICAFKPHRRTAPTPAPRLKDIATPSRAGLVVSGTTYLQLVDLGRRPSL